MIQSGAAVSGVETETGAAHAFHVGGGYWVTALHAIGAPGLRIITSKVQTVSCVVANVDPPHDLALLTCPGTSGFPRLALPAPKEESPSPLSTAVVSLMPDLGGRLVHQTVSVSHGGASADDCRLGRDAYLIDSVPAPGQSGAPIVVRYGDGREELSGVWLGEWLAGDERLGIAVEATSVAALVEAAPDSASFDELPRQSLASCRPVSSVRRPDVGTQCSAAARDPRFPFVEVRRRCAESLDSLVRLRADALTEEAILLSSSGPAGWVLVIDSAFAGRRGAYRWLASRSAELTKLAAAVHGTNYASAFELRVLSSAVERLVEESKRNPGLREDAEKLIGGSLQSLTPERLMFALGSKKIAESPPWMLCALAVGAGPKGLRWGPVGDFAACDVSIAWSDVLARTDKERGRCDASSRLETWWDWVYSPRAQAAFWLAIDELNLVNLDSGYKWMIAPFASDEAFSVGAAKTRAVLRDLSQFADAAAEPRSKRALETLAEMLGDEGVATPTAFLRTNLCRIPQRQHDFRGLAVDYGRALHDLAESLCSSADAQLRGPCKKSVSRRVPNPTPLAKEEMSAWLRASGLDVLLDPATVRIETDDPSTYWAILKPTKGVAFGESWVAESKKVLEKTGFGLDDAIVRAFALAMNVDGEHLAVYVDNPCDDLRIRLLPGRGVFSASVRCKQLAQALRRIKLNLEKTTNGMPPAAASDGVTNADMKDVRSALQKAIAGLGGRVGFTEGVSTRYHQQVEIDVTGLRGVITGNLKWERLEGVVTLDYDEGNEAIVQLRCAGSWASGSADTEPADGYKRIENEKVRLFIVRLLHMMMAFLPTGA